MTTKKRLHRTDIDYIPTAEDKLYNYAMGAGNFPDAIFRLDCLRMHPKNDMDAIRAVENRVLNEWMEWENYRRTEGGAPCSY